MCFPMSYPGPREFCRSPWLFLIPLLLPALTAETAEDPEAETRPYLLFVGIDPKVMIEEEFHPINDVRDNRALIDAPGAPAVALRDISRVLFEHATHLSHTLINLEEISSERAYSMQRDPRWESRSQRTALQGYRQDQLSVRQAGIANANLLPIQPDFGGPPGGQAAAPAPDFDPVGAAYAEFEDYSQSTEHFDSDEAYPTESGQTKDGQDFDAINLSFEISNPHVIRDIYVVAIARVRAPDESLLDKLWFRELDQIGPTPRSVMMRTSGLPDGFEIQSVKLHVFRDGLELANNLSEKQIPLTRDEAFQYLLIKHLGDHRGQSVAATPALSLAPPELWGATNRRDFDQPLAMWVDADGTVLGPAREQVVPAPLQEIIDQLYFLPALRDGSPVKGIAEFNLAAFFNS